MTIHELSAYLAALPTGPVAEDHAGEVISLLRESWEAFSGSSDTSMTSAKLTGIRVEDLTWDPPCLKFAIERHGGTVMGSKNAELHWWRVNLDSLQASCGSAGHRRLVSYSPKLDVRPLANDICQLITGGASTTDDRVTWRSATCVKVNVSVLIPDGHAKQTARGRRKRFRAALEPLMADAGWHRLKSETHLVFERGT